MLTKENLQDLKELEKELDIEEIDYSLKGEESKIALEEYRNRISNFNNSIGKLELNYLDNNQILTCMATGPYGWCDWEGNIGCNTFNVGKWPEPIDIYEDWVIIAEAFPFLDLTCQILDQETCVNDVPIHVVIEFIIKNGK